MPDLLFDPGRPLMTPGAAAALTKAGQTAVSFLLRHCAGDWGDVPPEDRALNVRALETGDRLMSVYGLPTGETLWLITEGDRGSTTLLLPEEY